MRIEIIVTRAKIAEMAELIPSISIEFESRNMYTTSLNTINMRLSESEMSANVNSGSNW